MITFIIYIFDEIRKKERIDKDEKRRTREQIYWWTAATVTGKGPGLV